MTKKLYLTGMAIAIAMSASMPAFAEDEYNVLKMAGPTISRLRNRLANSRLIRCALPRNMVASALMLSPLARSSTVIITMQTLSMASSTCS